uniref:Uncharacterized protein n=1 Tax=Leersia perrieri TaxID=77586 RepID=A0A0D9X200_9ORYZ
MYRFLYPDRPDRNTIHFPHGDTAGNASFPASGRVSTFIFVAPTSSQPRTRSPTSNSSRAILTVAFGVSKMGPMEAESGENDGKVPLTRRRLSELTGLLTGCRWGTIESPSAPPPRKRSVNGANVSVSRSNSSTCRVARPFRRVATAMNLPPATAAGVKQWTPGGVTLRSPSSPVGSSVSGEISTRKTLHHPSSATRWKNTSVSPRHAGHPPRLATTARLAGFPARNTATSVSSARKSNAHGRSPYDATATSSPEPDTAGLMSTTPSGVNLLTIPFFPMSIAYTAAQLLNGAAGRS